MSILPLQTHQQGRVESGHLGYAQAGLASSTWGLPPTGTVTHTDVLASELTIGSQLSGVI